MYPTPEDDSRDSNTGRIISELVKWPPPTSEIEDNIKKYKRKGDRKCRPRLSREPKRTVSLAQNVELLSRKMLYHLPPIR